MTEGTGCAAAAGAAAAPAALRPLGAPRLAGGACAGAARARAGGSARVRGASGRGPRCARRKAAPRAPRRLAPRAASPRAHRLLRGRRLLGGLGGARLRRWRRHRSARLVSVLAASLARGALARRGRRRRRAAVLRQRRKGGARLRASGRFFQLLLRRAHALHSRLALSRSVHRARHEQGHLRAAPPAEGASGCRRPRGPRGRAARARQLGGGARVAAAGVLKEALRARGAAGGAALRALQKRAPRACVVSSTAGLAPRRAAAAAATRRGGAAAAPGGDAPPAPRAALPAHCAARGGAARTTRTAIARPLPEQRRGGGGRDVAANAWVRAPFALCAKHAPLGDPLARAVDTRRRARVRPGACRPAQHRAAPRRSRARSAAPLLHPPSSSFARAPSPPSPPRCQRG
jgi:hypothetical protein